jgi:hypothetical protein
MEGFDELRVFCHIVEKNATRARAKLGVLAGASVGVGSRSARGGRRSVGLKFGR